MKMDDKLKLYWLLHSLGCDVLFRGDYVVLPKVKYRFNKENELVSVEER